MDEEFRRAAGFDKYIVSSLGYIKSDSSKGVKLKGNALKPAVNKSGYYHVTLMTNDGRPRTVRVARIVCETFHGPKPSSRHHVAHRDGAKSNNQSSNLCWATPEENQADRIIHGTDLRGEDVIGSKLIGRDIPVIRRLIESHVPMQIIAKAFQVDPTSILNIKKGNSWKHIQ